MPFSKAAFSSPTANKAAPFTPLPPPRAARHGSPTAMVELASLLYDAEHVGLQRPHNLSRVADLYRQAAQLNSTEGLFGLGWCSQHGVGLEANATQAQLLYLR